MSLYWYDTEFDEFSGSDIKLISIGIVCEDGREFYRESSEFDESVCNDWVKTNVIPKLGPKEKRKTREEIKKDLLDFIGSDDNVVMCGYVADYDHVVFCKLFGAMSQLPKVFKHYSWDAKQEMERLGLKKDDLPKSIKKGNHNSLTDAKWLKEACEYFKENKGLQMPLLKKKDEVEASVAVDALRSRVHTKYAIEIV